MCDCSQSTTGLGKWGSRVAGQAGDFVSNKLHKAFKDWTGFGDYKIVSNSLIENGRSYSEERTFSTNGRIVRVRGREYVGDLTTPASSGANAGPVSRAWPINPANVATFPWLSTIAGQYDQYRPVGLIFEFKSTATDSVGSATTNLGSVLMATEYDAFDRAPLPSKPDFLQMAYSQESRICDDAIHGVECDPRERANNWYNCAAIGSTPAADRDFAVFYTSVVNTPSTSANQSIGSLWVHYEFEFIKETPYGGILARNRLMQVQRYETAGFTAFNNMVLVTPLVAGRNLGFTLTHTTNPYVWTGNDLQVPTWCTNAMVKVTFIAYATSRGAVPSTAPTWVAHNPSGSPGTESVSYPTYPTGLTYYSAGQALYMAPVFGATLGAGTCMCVMYFKTKSFIPDRAAVQVDMGFMKAGDTGVILNVIYEVVPMDEWTATFT